MSKEENIPKPADSSMDEWSEVDQGLGQAMVLLNRMVSRLDDIDRAGEVQASFRSATACLEAARQAHQRVVNSRQVMMNIAAQAQVESEIVAIIAGAVAAVLDCPYRILSVEPLPVPAPHLNVWALEGRTQIFQSHKIR
jgi:hypothetical protein